MNIKKKFEAAKEKVKSNPEIAVAAVGLVTIAIGIVALKKQLPTGSGFFEPLAPVDDTTREQLLKDKDFLLYKLTENEYILDRPVPID